MNKDYKNDLFMIIIVLLLISVFISVLQYMNNIEGFGIIENDPVFDNAKFYQLDLTTTDDITGMPLCLKECKGKCVEYGVSGSAWCIPDDYEVSPVENGGTQYHIPK
jgi:hypothetical protein